MEDKAYTEETIEERITSEGERYEDSASSSSLSLSVGRRLPGLTMPLVEGMIVSRKSREDGSLDITLLLAPYVKKGVWIKAAICTKNSTKLSKRSVEKYKYPLPWGSKLTYEAIRHKGDNEWIKNTLEDINRELREENGELGLIEEEGEKRKHKSERKISISSRESSDSRGAGKGMVLRSSRRRSSRISALRKWSQESNDKDVDVNKKPLDRLPKSKGRKNSIWGNNSRSRREAYKKTRSSSGSVDSTRREEFEDKEVWDTEEEDDGMVYCPFTSKDIRRYIDVKESIKGRAIERRFIRQALHNLYRHYTSLQTFVDSIRAKHMHSLGQPFAVDMLWLEHHAIYIDCLLFDNLKGMWADWNEPILDLLVMAFLELTVRCMPRRQYPDKLEERVRRWMKKNQVGISSTFGPIPYFLQNAKITERGISWNNNNQYGRGRGQQFGTGRGESRGRGNFNGTANFRRGGTKPESKGSTHE